MCNKSQTMHCMSILQMEKKSSWKYLEQPEIQDGRQDGFHDHNSGTKPPRTMIVISSGGFAG